MKHVGTLLVIEAMWFGVCFSSAFPVVVLVTEWSWQ